MLCQMPTLACQIGSLILVVVSALALSTKTGLHGEMGLYYFHRGSCHLVRSCSLELVKQSCQLHLDLL
jgi:hypothetical protein